jgi:hypothetical protein
MAAVLERTTGPSWSCPTRARTTGAELELSKSKAGAHHRAELHAPRAELELSDVGALARVGAVRRAPRAELRAHRPELELSDVGAPA